MHSFVPLLWLRSEAIYHGRAPNTKIEVKQHCEEQTHLQDGYHWMGGYLARAKMAIGGSISVGRPHSHSKVDIYFVVFESSVLILVDWCFYCLCIF